MKHLLRPMILATLLVLATSASAGSICGTVRDAATQDPVESAGVFVYDDQGTFTGRAASTDALGAYCINALAPGLYSLEFRRDDYLFEFVANVEVTGDATDVDVSVPTTVLFAPPTPNPADGPVRFRFRVRDGDALTLAVFDVRGRLVRGWQGRGSGLDRELLWDLQGVDGRDVASGAYFAVLRTATSSTTHRLVVTR